MSSEQLHASEAPKFLDREVIQRCIDENQGKEGYFLFEVHDEFEQRSVGPSLIQAQKGDSLTLQTEFEDGGMIVHWETFAQITGIRFVETDKIFGYTRHVKKGVEKLFWNCESFSKLLISEPYDITVPRSKTLKQMIAAGKYGSAEGITSDRFEIEKGTDEQVQVLLLWFRELLHSAEILHKMEHDLHLQPAKVEHLLALAAQHPELQTKHPIAALGSPWHDERIDRTNAALRPWDRYAWQHPERYPAVGINYQDKRNLGLTEGEGTIGWERSWNFAAIKKPQAKTKK